MKRIFLGIAAAGAIGATAVVSFSTPGLAYDDSCVASCYSSYHSCMYNCGDTKNYHCSSACESARSACVSRCY
jgi:hypothetical protein